MKFKDQDRLSRLDYFLKQMGVPYHIISTITGVHPAQITKLVTFCSNEGKAERADKFQWDNLDRFSDAFNHPPLWFTGFLETPEEVLDFKYEIAPISKKVKDWWNKSYLLWAELPNL